MKEKISYERLHYGAVADAPQTETIYGKTCQILSPALRVKNSKCISYFTP